MLIKANAYTLTVLALIPMAVTSSLVRAAETKLSPELRTAIYGYQLENADQDGKVEDSAWELAPSILWQRQAANMSTRLSWQHETIFYSDDQRNKLSFNDLGLNNQIRFFQQRIAWDLDASQSYQVRNSRQGVFSDKITGAENLSKVQRLGTGLAYRSLPTAQYQTDVQLRFDTMDSARPIVDDDLQELSTDIYSASWLFGSNQRGLNFFWQYSGGWQAYDRSAGSDVSSLNHIAIIGVPIAPKVSVVGRAGSERVDNSSTYDNNFDFFGAGVEFRFGVRSRINVTMNRSDSEIAGQKKQTDTYVASDFLIAPTRRTRLEGSFDRRYFGRTLQLTGNYDLRFLSMRLRMSEAVRTQNAFEREQEELGIFVCPDGSNDLASCFKPPSDRYVPVFGESLQRVTLLNVELREELVEVRSTGFSLGYSKNRLNLNLTANDSETRYVETGNLNQNRSLALQASWRFNDNNKVAANLSIYRIDYRSGNRKDDNISAAVSYHRTLNDKSDLTVTARRLERDSTDPDFDNSENRIWVEYRYRF